MDEAIAFMHTFIQKEHETYVAKFTERDEARYKQQWREVLGFYTYGQTPVGISRPRNPDEAWFAKGAEGLAAIHPRRFFQIKQYHHAELGGQRWESRTEKPESRKAQRSR